MSDLVGVLRLVHSCVASRTAVQ